MNPPPVIALLTDFGTRDPYVGIMKGVILSRCPGATLIDLTHEIAPQDVQQGAFALAAAVPYLPPQTVYLSVVDPGVGTARATLAVETSGPTFLAPDNGLLTLALQVWERGGGQVRGVYRIDTSRYALPVISHTFHGRDIFAPAAALVACGLPVSELGKPMPREELLLLPVEEPQVQGDEVQAHVQYVDRFGNLVTSLCEEHLSGRRVHSITAEEHFAPLRESYREARDGEFLCIWGSFNRLELAQSMGSAAATLGLDAGDLVRVRLVDVDA